MNMINYDEITSLVDEWRAMVIVFLDISKALGTASHNTPI